jgi:hypothetical protein
MLTLHLVLLTVIELEIGWKLLSLGIFVALIVAVAFGRVDRR